MMFTEITQAELPNFLAQEATILVDVRETWEYADFNLGGINIPPHEVTDRIEELSAYKNIVVVCSNGTRSSIVARLLAKKIPSAQIFHLAEGIF